MQPPSLAPRGRLRQAPGTVAEPTPAVNQPPGRAGQRPGSAPAWSVGRLRARAALAGRAGTWRRMVLGRRKEIAVPAG